MPTAKVKWFNPLVGYGYLIMPDGREVFFHSSESAYDLTIGQSVTFDLYESGKGWSARDVKVDE